MEHPPFRPRVLIVDDVLSNIELLWQALKSQYKISFATNGLDALRLAGSDNPPNLILLDIMMDGMDGYEVCNRLKGREKTRSIPVIFLTAMGGDEDETRGLGMGAVDYIRKPFNLATVKARVKTQIELELHRNHLEDLVKSRTAEILAVNEHLRSEVRARLLAEEALRQARDGLEIRVRERTSELLQLLRTQEINIGLAKAILGLVNGLVPRYIDLPDNLTLFIEAFSIPCHSEGGDHFFVRHLSGPNGRGRTVLSLKDQSGHSVGCVLRSIITDLIHNALLNNHRFLPLEKIIRALNEEICRSSLFSAEDFFTSMSAEIIHETLTLRYLSAGHPPMLLIRDGKVISLPGDEEATRNLPIAVISGMDFTAGEWTLREGDKVIAYTDGLNEMTRKSRDKIISTREMEEMASDIIRQDPGMSVSDIARHLLASIAALSREEVIPFGKNTSGDDITIVCLEVENRMEGYKEVWKPRDSEAVADRIEELYGKIQEEWRRRGFQDFEPRVRIVLEEAIMNAWKHGNRCSSEKTITVRRRYGNDFHLEVIDEGNGFDPGRIPDPTDGDNLSRPGGRGIFIARHYAGSVQWSDEGRHLTACFKKYPNPAQEKHIERAGRCMELWRGSKNIEG